MENDPYVRFQEAAVEEVQKNRLKLLNWVVAAAQATDIKCQPVHPFLGELPQDPNAEERPFAILAFSWVSQNHRLAIKLSACTRDLPRPISNRSLTYDAR